jgi:CRP-like cAMP-binding protein
MTGDHERSALDEAWSAWIGARPDDAIRGAAALLEHDPGQLGAAALLLEVLIAQNRTKLAKRASERLADASIRRGDLARAIAITILAARAELDPSALRKQIASAFAHGSPRIANVSLPPPPLPPKHDVPAAFLSLAGGALLDRAEEVLEAFLQTTDPRSASSPLPRLPFFGALGPAALEQLIGAWEIREVAAGEPAIEEGTEGRDAFIVVRGRLRAERKRAEDRAVLALLGPGALFGEMALVSDAPRAASVVAEEPSQLLAASRGALEKLAEKTPAIGKELSDFCRTRMIANLLRHSQVLRAVEPAKRADLIARFETRAFKAGETLVKMGQEPEGLFLLASGGVRVLGRDQDGEELQIAQLGPGDVVGEISLVLRRPATADVRATHLTIALELRRDPFREVIKEHPTLLNELYELATKREEEMRSVVAQEALDVEEVVLL